MTQRTWSTTDVSAYLDGQLEPKRQAALEADMEHNAALRTRVEEMKQVISIVRAEPLREPPRNYLLTPAMVAGAAPRPARVGGRRRMPLLALRLATSMVALAFVVTFGLTALQGNLIPGLRTGASEAPLPAQNWESVDEAETEALPEERGEMPRAMVAPVEPDEQADQEEAPAMEAEESPSEPAEALMAPAPETAADPAAGAASTGMAEEGEAVGGLGGGEEPEEPEMSGLALEAPAAEEAPPAPESTMVSPEITLESDSTDDLQRKIEPREEAVAQDRALDGGEAQTLTLTVEADRETTPKALPTEEAVVQRFEREGLSPWVSRGLGIATVVLAAVTLWVTHHPLSRRR